MTEYRTYVDADNKYFAVTDHKIVGGPYDTEEKAKRRIRDLKRKEAERIAPNLPAEEIDAMIADEPSNIVDPTNVSPEDRAFINAGRFVDIDPQPVITASPASALYNPALCEAMTEAARAVVADVTANINNRDEGSCYDTYSEDEAYRSDSSMRRGQRAFRRNMIQGVTPFRAYYKTTQDYGGKPRNGYRPAHRANRLRSARK